MKPAKASFTPIDSVLDGQSSSGSRINVIGLVIDFRAPVPTKGDDYKAQIRLYDESIQEDESKSLTINIFRKQDAMPKPSCGDVILIFGAKVQTYMADFSLMTNWTTDIYIFTASKIPRPPNDATNALQASMKKPSRVLTKSDYAYVPVFYRDIDKKRLPTAAEFHIKMTKSLKVKRKFSLLKDIACDTFVDIIVEVVKEPYDLGDKFTLWVSDYTEHSNFYNFALKNLPTDGQGDPYKYHVSSNTAADHDWRGPYGKRSMQVTCFAPHVEAIRTQCVSAGSWVSIRNLQIRYGRNSTNLEGFLRSDNQINISVLDHLEDGDNMDIRLKDTIRRRRDYERERKGQLKAINEAAKAGQKRRAALDDDAKPRKPNAKSRRDRKRRAAQNITNSEPKNENGQSPTQNADSPTISEIQLNSAIKCENEKQPVSSVAELLEQIYVDTLVGKDAVRVPLPFINANYHAHVRVKDFLPRRIEDFAFAKMKSGLYDALSDDDDDNAASSSSDEDQGDTLDRFVTTERLDRWEWRFYLCLEDARDAKEGEPKSNSVWVTVDNPAAQCLLNMDAHDLRNSKAHTSQLREKLFLLWGDLEERKTAQLLRSEQAEKHAKADKPPVDSDDDDDDEGVAAGSGDAADSSTPANRPFACCIRQYGVKLREPDEAKADAGHKRRWQRMYGLFGTQIAMPEAPPSTE